MKTFITNYSGQLLIIFVTLTFVAILVTAIITGAIDNLLYI